MAKRGRPVTSRRPDYKDLTMMLMMHQGNPSIHDMKDKIHARSTGTVAHRLKKLEELGLVVQPSVRQARSREVTDRGIEVLKGANLIQGEEDDATVQFQGGTRGAT